MTNAEARFSNSLHPWKPEGSLGRTALDVNLDSHTAPELSGSALLTLFIPCNCMSHDQLCMFEINL